MRGISASDWTPEYSKARPPFVPCQAWSRRGRFSELPRLADLTALQERHDPGERVLWRWWRHVLHRRLQVVREGLPSAEKELRARVIIVVELREIAVGIVKAWVIRNPECHACAGVLLAGGDEV